MTDRPGTSFSRGDSGLLGRRTFFGALGLAALGLAGCAPSHRNTQPLTTAPSSPSSTTPAASTGRLVWSDEFSAAAGAPVSSAEWFAMNLGDGWGNQELEAYTPRTANLSHDGSGALRIRALREDYTDPEGHRCAYTSARIESARAFRYGRIEARIKVPSGAGLWPAFWTIGRYDDQVQWPQTGEIDIMEYVDADVAVNANVHADTSTGGTWSLGGSQAVEAGFAQAWHIYRVDWTTDSLVFSIDDQVYHHVIRSALQPGEVWEFDRPQYLILNLAVGGTYPSAPTDPSVFPAEMLIDYVRVYDSEIHERLAAP